MRPGARLPTSGYSNGDYPATGIMLFWIKSASANLIKTNTETNVLLITIKRWMQQKSKLFNPQKCWRNQVKSTIDSF